MFKRIVLGVALLGASCVLISCGGEPGVAAEEKDIVSRVCMPEMEGNFRGVYLGDSYPDVRNGYGQESKSDADSVLEYHHMIEWKNVENKLVVYFSFDSFGLFEIQADLFIGDKAKTDEAFGSFQTHFDSLYGAPDCTGQFCRWTTYSRSNNVVEVTLSNESFNPDHPFLSINYLEPLSNEI